MAVLYSNNASTTLSASITNVATSLSVAAGSGSEFPALSGSDYFYATLTNTAGAIEIIKVTARTADTMTIVRGQDGTTALAWASGDIIELRITKAMLDDLKGERVPTTGGVISGNLGLGNANPATSNTGGDLFMPTDSEVVWAGVTGNLTVNAVWNTAWKYVVNGAALREKMTSTGWEWYAAASGTAGATITFGTPKATLDLSGNLALSGTVAASSDESIKTNWRALQIDFVDRLAGVKHGVYDRTDTDTPTTQVGVGAQSLQKLLPEAVFVNKDGLLSVAYGNAALVAAVKLAERVLELERRIEKLEAKNGN